MEFSETVDTFKSEQIAANATNLETFRDKVKNYRRPTSHSQNELAAGLSLHPAVLSNKLNGVHNAYLTNPEIKQIVLILARWQAITRQSEAVELLQLMNLKFSSFSQNEWNSPPLSLLDNDYNPDLKTLSPLAYSTATINHNLPAQVTPLVGRAAQVSTLKNMLQEVNVRLVTLNGAGGIGKSRLALRVASELVNDFEYGAWWIELADLTEPNLVVQTIAKVLGLEISGSDNVLQTVTNHLRHKHILLVLDNFEQVINAGADISYLLSQAPKLKMLITSRIVLHLQGEHQFEVPPLNLPTPQDLTNPEHLRQNEAITLFLQRVKAVRRDFDLNAENATAIAQICERLDGLPLALELAAARLKLLTPATLLAHLTGNEGTLTGLQLLAHTSFEPQRHQTLRRTIEWSYEALPLNAKKLFYTLAVFKGGCSLEAITFVIDKTEGEKTINTIDLLDLVGVLVDNSLLRHAEASSEERFGFLEVIREFALEKLTESNQESQVRAAHADYFLNLVERAETEIASTNQSEWLKRLDLELSNIRVAFNWFLTSDTTETTEKSLRLEVALSRFWLIRGYLSEGRTLAKLTLHKSSNTNLNLRGRVFNSAGTMANIQGDYTEAKTLYNGALQIWQQLGDKAGLAQALNNLGNVGKEQGDFDQAQSYYEQSLQLYRELNNKNGIALVANNLGSIAVENGEYEQATTLYEESLALKREIGNRGSIALSLTNLGFTELLKGDFAQARILYQEALEIHEQLGNKSDVALTYYNLGEVALYEKRFTDGEHFLQKSLQLLYDLQIFSSIPRCLEGLAAIALEQDQIQHATQLFGKADQLRETYKVSVPPSERSRYNKILESLHTRLTPELFTKYWQQGRVLLLEQLTSKA